MKSKINIYLIEYSINAILRQKYKSFFIFSIFTFLIFILTSVFFITNSIKNELNSTVDKLPQIIVQKIKAGRHYDIDIKAVDKILNISGVSEAIPRVWGYYYFENAGVNFSIVGIDQYETQYKNRGINLVCIVNKWSFRTPSNLSKIMNLQKSTQKKLSKAAIETLAIIVYHQPVTRSEIESIRGVSFATGTLEIY